MTFLTIFRVMEILCNSRLVLEGKTGKEIPESSRLEFLEKFSTNNFALSDVNLPLLITLLTIHQESQEPSFLEMMDSFVLLAYGSLVASKTLLQ